MFVLRVAFWLTLVILLIPADSETGEAPRVTLGNAFLAAKATLTDLSGFCDRNPDVCVTGKAAADAVYQKAESGIRMLYRYIDGEDAVEVQPAEPEGTLSKDDLALPWTGPAVVDEPLVVDDAV